MTPNYQNHELDQPEGFVESVLISVAIIVLVMTVWYYAGGGWPW